MDMDMDVECDAGKEPKSCNLSSGEGKIGDQSFLESSIIIAETVTVSQAAGETEMQNEEIEVMISDAGVSFVVRPMQTNKKIEMEIEEEANISSLQHKDNVSSETVPDTPKEINLSGDAPEAVVVSKVSVNATVSSRSVSATKAKTPESLSKPKLQINKPSSLFAKVGKGGASKSKLPLVVPIIDERMLIPKSTGAKRKLPTSTTTKRSPGKTESKKISPSKDESANKEISLKPGPKSDDVCVLVAGKKLVPTLQSVLSEASLEFKQLLESSPVKSKLKIDFPNPNVLPLFVKKLTDKSNLTLEEAKDLITPATKYKVDSLLHECHMAFVEYTNQNNILEIKFLAIDSKNEVLNNYIDKQLPTYLKSVVKSNDFLQLSMDKFGKLIARENLCISQENIQILADAWLAHDKRGYDPSLYTQVHARVLLRLDENWSLSLLDGKPERDPLSTMDPSRIPGWIFLQSLVTPKKCIGAIINIPATPLPPKNKLGECIKIKCLAEEPNLAKPTDGIQKKRKRMEDSDDEWLGNGENSPSKMRAGSSSASLQQNPKLPKRPTTPMADWGDTNEDSSEITTGFQSRTGYDCGGKFGRGGNGAFSNGNGGGRDRMNNDDDGWGSSNIQSAALQNNQTDDDDWGGTPGNSGLSQSQWGGNGFNSNESTWGNSNNGEGRGRGGNGRGRGDGGNGRGRGDGGNGRGRGDGGNGRGRGECGRLGRGRGRDSFGRSDSNDWGSGDNGSNGTSGGQQDDWGGSNISSWSNSGREESSNRSTYGNDRQRGGRGGGDRGRGSSRGRGDFSNRSRENNWICGDSSCGADNFPTRIKCYKCYTPKPGDGGSGGNERSNNRRGGGFRGGRGGYNDRGNSNQWGSSQATTTTNVAADDEDWDTPTPTPAAANKKTNLEDDDWDTSTLTPAAATQKTNSADDEWNTPPSTPTPTAAKNTDDDWDDKPSAKPGNVPVSSGITNTGGINMDDSDEWGNDSTTELEGTWKEKTAAKPASVVPSVLPIVPITTKVQEDMEWTSESVPTITVSTGNVAQDDVDVELSLESAPANATVNVEEDAAFVSMATTSGALPVAEKVSTKAEKVQQDIALNCEPVKQPTDSTLTLHTTLISTGVAAVEAVNLMDPRVAKRLKVSNNSGNNIETNAVVAVQKPVKNNCTFEYRPKLIEGVPSSYVHRGWNSSVGSHLSEPPPSVVVSAAIIEVPVPEPIPGINEEISQLAEVVPVNPEKSSTPSESLLPPSVLMESKENKDEDDSWG